MSFLKNRGVVFFVFVVLAFLAGCTERRVEPLRGPLNGDAWSRMTSTEKTFFLEGYRSGNSAGHRDACELISNADKEHLPQAPALGGVLLDRCQGHERSWSKGTARTIEAIDSFYTRFPDDRDVQVTNLISNLSDQSGLTIGQIHDMKAH